MLSENDPTGRGTQSAKALASIWLCSAMMYTPPKVKPQPLQVTVSVARGGKSSLFNLHFFFFFPPHALFQKTHPSQPLTEQPGVTPQSWKFQSQCTKSERVNSMIIKGTTAVPFVEGKSTNSVCKLIGHSLSTSCVRQGSNISVMISATLSSDLHRSAETPRKFHVKESE